MQLSEPGVGWKHRGDLDLPLPLGSSQFTGESDKQQTQPERRMVGVAVQGGFLEVVI